MQDASVIKSYIHGIYRWEKVGNEEQQKAKEHTTQAPQGLGTEGTLCVPVNWLDHGRTLREQGVEEHETLLLRRKFFYSDQNVDSRDPVQLNLLYVQVWRGFAWGRGGRERGQKHTEGCPCTQHNTCHLVFSRREMTSSMAPTLSPSTRPVSSLASSARSSLGPTMSRSTRLASSSE